MHRKIIGVIQKASEDFQSALAWAALNKITGIKKIDKCIWKWELMKRELERELCWSWVYERRFKNFNVAWNCWDMIKQQDLKIYQSKSGEPMLWTNHHWKFRRKYCTEVQSRSGLCHYPKSVTYLVLDSKQVSAFQSLPPEYTKNYYCHHHICYYQISSQI